MKEITQFLIEQGADSIPHSDRTLLEHLINVEKILRICQCSDSVCKAGLIHSVYGTEFFTVVTTTDREAVKKIAGERAEYLAWIFCNAMRPFCWFTNLRIPLRDGTFIEIDKETRKDLQMIEGANLLEQQLGFEILVSMASQNE